MSAKLFVTAFVLGVLASWQGRATAQGQLAPAEETAGKKTTGVVAYLLVNPRKPLLPSLESPETPEQYQLLKRTTVEYMRTKPLLIRALRDPAVSKLSLVRDQVDPVQWLADNLTFEYPNDAAILRIRLRTHHAEDAQRVLDSVVGAFFKEVVEKEIVDRQKEELRLREVYEERREQIVRLTKEVLAMKQAVGPDKAGDTPEIAQRLAHIKQLEMVADALDARCQQLQIQKHERSRIQKLDDAIIEIFGEAPEDGV